LPYHSPLEGDPRKSVAVVDSRGLHVYVRTEKFFCRVTIHLQIRVRSCDSLWGVYNVAIDTNGARARFCLLSNNSWSQSLTYLR